CLVFKKVTKNSNSCGSQEGLGDLSSQISVGSTEEESEVPPREVKVREKYDKAIESFFLPVLAYYEQNHWRPLVYEVDILSKIDWGKANFQNIFDIALSKEETKDTESIATINDADKLEEKSTINTKNGQIDIDPVFFCRQIIDIVPNPWMAFGFAEKVICGFSKKHSKKSLKNNFVYIIEETKKILQSERDRLAQQVFYSQIDVGKIRLLVIGKDLGFRLPRNYSIETKSYKLTKENRDPIQQSLYDFVPEDELNEMEKSVAWFLDDQKELFFWYRNQVRKDYFVQGWKPQKVYPDFIFTKAEDDQINEIYVVETKGIQLQGNEDTKYKTDLFDLCNKKSFKQDPNGFVLKYNTTNISYRVIYGDQWKNKLNELFSY
ncbi:MAG: restriction endonuclease subunit R, partial [Patescibacteria group bacterium]